MVCLKLVLVLVSMMITLAVGSQYGGAGGGGSQYGGSGGAGGQSNSFRKQDDLGNYAFGYNIRDPQGATNSRKESGDGYGNKEGSYSLADTDGRQRTVVYWADKGGFRAKIQSNEPSVITHEAADASYSANDATSAQRGGSFTYSSGGPGKW